MTYFYAFLFCGFVCAVSQYVLEKTKFTPGHINTILVIVGAFLSAFGLYDKIILTFGAGATVPIMNFGHLLVSAASEGYLQSGLLGLFTNLFASSSATLAVTILFAFIISLMFRVKN